MRRFALWWAGLAISCAGEETRAWTDVEGRAHPEPRGVVVLLFTSTECPMSNAHLPRVGDLSRDFPSISFFSINSNRNQSGEQAAAHAKKLEVPFPTIRDEGGRLADRYGVDLVPTAVVLDAQGKVRYRGRVDDHKIRDCVRERDLRRALQELSEGRPVSVPETPVEGCYVMRAVPADEKSPVTYSSSIAAILHRHCAGCHVADGPAPFPLEEYGQASAWARSIKRSTQARRMPPWKPVSNKGGYYDERGLSEAEIAALAEWADRGAPAGDLAAAPKPSAPPSGGWLNGPPDLVLEAGALEVSAQGDDVYRCYVLNFDFPEDRYLRAVELRVRNFRVVHHLLAWVDTTGAARKRDASDPGPGYKTYGSDPGFLPSGLIGGWAPGQIQRGLPPGVALHVPKGAAIVLDTHYHKSGRVEKDPGTQIGFYFAKGTVEKIVRTRFFANLTFTIPAGAENHVVTSRWRVPDDIHVLSVVPHMHLLGRRACTVARFPDGAERDLVRIDDWDFNWQEMYAFKEPLAIPRGTTITHSAAYDNSEKNRNNPNRPPRAVRWGEQTTDEMQIVFLSYTRDREKLNVTDPSAR